MAYIDKYGVEYSDDKKTLVKYPKDFQGAYSILEGVTTIGEYAFLGCSALTSITIGSSVTTIGNNAFAGCSGLTKTNYTGTIVDWCKIKFGNFYYDNPMYYSHNLFINDVEVKDLVIPEGVESIGHFAFYNCSSLTSVTIGNSVTEIGDYAFYGCTSLTSVTIGNSVASIGKKAFYECTGLKSVTISNSVTMIGHFAFYNCSSLASVTIGNSVTTIGEYAFYNCSGLTSVTIPNTITEIGDYAFARCSGLTSVTIPNSVTTIGDYAFNSCSGLISVTIPNSVTKIGWRAFTGCSGLTSVTIPNSVTTIGHGAFRGCSGLTSVTIGDSVTSIGNGAFWDCKGLIAIEIPNSITTIGEYAFFGCSALTSVTIGDSVTSIGRNAFGRCSSLQGIEIPQKIKYLHGGTFADCENLLWMKLNGEVNLIHPIDLFGCQLPKEFQLVVPTDKLNYYKNSAFKTYRITDNLVSPTRTWEECVDQWVAKKQFYTSGETWLHKSIAELLNKGLVPSSFPPFGIELTVFEYREFKKEGRDIKSIEGWCESGIYIHQCVRRRHNSVLDFFDENSNWMGERTPRKGFYKVISKSDDGKILNCYYNYKRGNAFLEEIVEINSKPFSNKASIGPRHALIQVDDIIEVMDTRLIESIYEGQSYKAYCIVWNFVDNKHLSTPTYTDSNEDRSSYAQYGGYNDWDDDTINSAFEGDPEATWNID